MTTSREARDVYKELSQKEVSIKGLLLMVHARRALSASPEFAIAASTTFLGEVEEINPHSFRPISFNKEDSQFEVSIHITPDIRSLRIYRGPAPGRPSVLVNLKRIQRGWGRTFYGFSYYDDVEHTSNGIRFTGYSTAGGDHHTSSAAAKIEAVLEELER